MANEDQDNAKVDPKNVVSVEYNDISEEERQVLEAHLKEFEVEYKRMIASCYGRTWQCMVEKPMLPSKETNNVSISSPSVFDQFASILGDKINESRKFTQDLIISLTNQVQVLSKGKGVDHSNSNGTLNPSSSATPVSTPQPLHGMPPNYFAGQTPPPPSLQLSTAEPVRPIQQTSNTNTTCIDSLFG